MEAKLCTRCGKVKPVDDFHRWRRDGRQPWCKECRKVYDAAYHRKTWGPARLEQKRQRQREFSAWFRGLKVDRPCADCGLVFDPAVMQWDHLPGTTKLANLSDLGRGANRARVLEEIEKCELVCANCHALRTVSRRGA